MMTDLAPALALGLYLTGLVAAFGVRSWIHRARTGSTGFRGISGAPGTAEWWGGVLFAVALVLGAAGPSLALTGSVTAPRLPEVIAWAGLVITVGGFVGVLVSQAGMGASWRIGVDAAERTELVTTEVFAVIRNPVFTAMLTTLLGLTLLVPTVVSAAAWLCLLLAVELQVRLVEEPYLLATHPQDYGSYAAGVGRFLPGLGRLQRIPQSERNS
ncbi:isoprenylcysteine carboxylmethyltransferase family protein [Kocuria sediminis]|uniref:Isoprenylcysteine carboxylmethyltransferase family protein n=1 Tax=Kocuria sediminis TaxID=1038857 RepID=A0A6N8GP62_9MICC|nr:isoprenylcysteine carboxylmethyltransferase family protein [Kocuria sediminis]MUN64698.1 isoprenylcysteine carboxylmethyltransferase family protein [Kocuria sediminis]